MRAFNLTGRLKVSVAFILLTIAQYAICYIHPRARYFFSNLFAFIPNITDRINNMPAKNIHTTTAL
mgnify:CR=1 FL=1